VDFGYPGIPQGGGGGAGGGSGGEDIIYQHQVELGHRTRPKCAGNVRMPRLGRQCRLGWRFPHPPEQIRSDG
jgi:hypothetical protein